MLLNTTFWRDFFLGLANLFFIFSTFFLKRSFYSFVLLAADCSSVRSILVYKHDEEKIRVLDSHKLVASAGPQADCVQFVEYVQRNVALNEFRSGLKMSTHAVTSYVRTQLHEALRKNPYQVNLLVGGFDGVPNADGIVSSSSTVQVNPNSSAASSSASSALGSPSLYFIDYLGSSQKMNFAAHGYASYFIFSTMDCHWRPNMNLEQALVLVRKCIQELKTRFLVNQPNWKIKIADANGTRDIEFTL